MKYIYIILTIFVLQIEAFSQSLKLDITHPYNPNATELLKLFDEYEQYCYDDSTQILCAQCWSGMETIEVCPYEIGVDFFMIECNDTYYKWIHREPEFTDFIIWLRSKINNL